ncbi:MAG: hypothetical protein AABZ47_01620 [Planctomycetota bacterium]
MFRSKKTKYMVLVSVAVVGLAVDRFLWPSSSPTPVSAETSSSINATGTSGPPNSSLVIEKSTTVAASENAAILPDVAFPRVAGSWIPEVGKVRDIFALPSSDESQQYGDGGAPRRAGSKLANGRAMFTQQFQLHGILVRDDLKIAVVGGQWLQIGDTIGGCKLTDITGTDAIFRCQDGNVTLTTVNLTERSPD